MSRVFFSRLALSAMAMAALSVSLGTAIGAEPPSEAAPSETARLDVYTQPGDASYFALSLKPNQTATVPQARDVVVLFDSSASQTGKFRTDGLTALDSLLKKLGPNDRVKLIAVDLGAISLTDAFISPRGDEIKAALAKLKQRSPLGSTDMEKAMSAAVAAGKDAQKPKAVVYLGDGMSAANLLGTKKFETIVNSLVEAKMPVNSFAVGPRLDMQLLGALAGRTGGVMVEQDNAAAAKAGEMMAAAADAVVYWPKSAELPKDRLAEVFPKQLPPLRSDRDSVVVGVIEGDGPVTVKATLETAAGSKEMTWSIVPGKSSPGNKYLARLVDLARADEGLSLPIIGSDSLELARTAGNIALINLEALAGEALATGNLDGAKRLADEVLRRDPKNKQALAIKTKVDEKAAEGDLNLVGGKDDNVPLPEDGAFAQAFAQERNVIAQQVTKSVQVAINEARGVMSERPENAIQDLKLQLEQVRRVPDLNPDVRDQLVDQLQAALRLAAERLKTAEHARQQRAQSESAAREREMLVLGLARRQEKVKQLMRKFDSLMNESRYREANYRMAEEKVAQEAQDLVGEGQMEASKPAIANATLWARTKRYHMDNVQVRVARQRAVADCLASVEISHKAFDDREPILYPDPEVFRKMSERRISKYSAMDLATRGEAEQRINRVLQDKTTFEFEEQSLQEVVIYLQDRHEITIILDKKALDDEGLDPETPITFSVKNVSLRAALRQMLHDYDLTYIIENEMLVITTATAAQDRLSTRVYPVADLVIPVQSFSGGMGMMGGGGMGGGMFNVPLDLLPQKARDMLPKNVPAGGFRAFSVDDDLSKAPVKKASRPTTIDIEITKSSNPQELWDEYFSNHAPQTATVRETVRRLMGEKQYVHVIALIQAALKNQQAQPWMYEAMALAMQIDGQNLDDIERAIMSAVDFAENPLDLMYVGAYLSDLGLHQRALQVFQQVAKLVPNNSKPFIHGLRAAQKADDIEGIKWATSEIMGRAWPKDEADVWLRGVRVARATLKRLKDENREEEAKEFEKSLNQALVRDVVAYVRWSGDADIDIQVQEPTGTVGSSRNPCTTAGGIMMGDKCSVNDADNTKGFAEVYVCPRGFDGTYKLLIQRVWGEVTGGKVTVDVFIHVNTDKSQHIQKRISLDGDQAMVVFDLQDGRREKSIKREQIAANAAAEQIAVRQHVLAQQMAAGVDPQAMMSMARSRQDDAGGGNGGRGPFVPFARGAVGYQPQITMLQAGAMMMVTGVVSADRRYVRVSPMPMFSSIGEVNTFNFVTGEGGTTGGGNIGGGGMGGGGMGGGGMGGGGMGGGGMGGGGMGGGMGMM